MEIKQFSIPVSIVLAGIIVAVAIVSTSDNDLSEQVRNVEEKEIASISSDEITPKTGVTIPVVWGDLGERMVKAGVIDRARFDKLYEQRGGLSAAEKELLDGDKNGNLAIDPDNSGFILNILWALGLGNKNIILENGPMSDEKYGGAGSFASTGGWTLAEGDAMDHYSRHSFFALTGDQQALVERVSKNIYRPCCDNSTYFPDCNHGMAMLGLLELMASQGVGEADMYKIALRVNSYWFPNNYQTIATYLRLKGVEWATVDPKNILSANFSSASAYQNILSSTQPAAGKGGVGCGV